MKKYYCRHPYNNEQTLLIIWELNDCVSQRISTKTISSYNGKIFDYPWNKLEVFSLANTNVSVHMYYINNKLVNKSIVKEELKKRKFKQQFDKLINE